MDHIRVVFSIDFQNYSVVVGHEGSLFCLGFRVDAEGGEKDECLLNIRKQFSHFFHVVFAFLFEVSDLLQLLPSALHKNLDVASAHGDSVGEETQLAIYPFSQADYLP